MFFVEKACVLTLINPPWVDWMGTYDRSSDTLILNFVRAAAGKDEFLGRRRGPFKNDMWVIFWNYSWYLSVAPAKSIVRSWSSLNRKHTNRLHIDSKDVATTNPSMDMSSPIDELWSSLKDTESKLEDWEMLWVLCSHHGEYKIGLTMENTDRLDNRAHQRSDHCCRHQCRVWHR